MNSEFDYKAAGFKYSSIYEMRICGTIKSMKNAGYSLEKCIEYFNSIENFRNITTEDRIKEFYSDKFTL